MNDTESTLEIVDVEPGLWLWRRAHPEWSPPWDPLTSSFCVEEGGEVVLIDPLAPAAETADFWSRLDATPPTVVAILNPHHLRDVDVFIRRYGASGFGPRLFFADYVPEVPLEPIETGTVLPGGARAVHDGRDRGETPLWLAEHHALVFGDDARGTPDGLRFWDVPWYEQRTLPAMRKLLELPFERVLTCHGNPLHGRRDFEAAIEAAPTSNEEQATRAGFEYLP